jgi:CDGSH-type Zn-finger protein
VTEDEKEDRKPSITFTKSSPYRVTNLKHLRNLKGEDLPVKPVMVLCRCGASRNKPYCDGSHSKISFVGEKDPSRVCGQVNEYVGKDITIVDNTDVCCRDRSCINDLPQVFENCDPNAASSDEIIKTIRKCPSGALTYKIGGNHCQDFGREPAITVSRNGPLKVVGGIELRDDMNSRPACNEHYTLCRCGGSKNKPFCDGSHLDNGFKDDSKTE